MSLLSNAELRDAFRQKEAAGHHDYGAEHRREEREQATVNLLKAEAEERRAERYEESRYRKGSLRWTRATFVVSLITMAAVIYYALVAVRQHNAMTKQVTEMREANRLTRVAQERTTEVVAAENRAWLGVKAVNIETGVGQPITATLIVGNSGKVPAINVRMRGRCAWPDASPENPPVPSQERPAFVALPNSEQKFVCLTDKRLTAEDLQALLTGRAHFVYAGSFEYTDRFGGTHHTRFCSYTDARTKGVSECPVGNNAD